MTNLELGKEKLFNTIDPWFQQAKYTFYPQGSGQYRYEDTNWIYAILFNFSSSSDHHINSTILMHSKFVEPIITNNGIPSVNLESYATGENILFTIQDKENLEVLKYKRDKIDLSHHENFVAWGKLIIEYMEGPCKDFITKYFELPTILQRINEIDKNGGANYLELLTGGIDHLFRALIISRLCNDPEYQKKQDRFDGHILQSKYAKWHPYYESLKMKLLTTVPIYDWNI